MFEKLCLKWNDYQDNVNSAFACMRGENDFADVTLACEDGHPGRLEPILPKLAKKQQTSSSVDLYEGNQT